MKDKGRKILAFYVYDNQHELVETTTRLMLERGIQMDAICVTSFRYIKGTKMRWPWLIYIANFFINKLKFPKAQGFFRTRLGNKYYKQLIDKYDFIDFQSFPDSQVELAEYCISKQKEYMIGFWGSDLLRADDDILKRKKKSLDHSKVICVDAHMAKKIDQFFTEYFGIGYSSKYKGSIDGITNGNKDIFMLDGLTEKDIKKVESTFHDIKDKKLIVTIGYNGNPKQNQDKVLEILVKLPTELKNKIHLVFPMTYAATPSHLAKIEKMVSDSGVSYKILDKFLTNKEICVLRAITNIFIMVQDTDAFAGSVRSHFYCQNVCLIADWIEYPLDKNGVYYKKVNWDNLLETISDVIINYEDNQAKCISNKEKMLPFMTWDKYIEMMCNLYD